MRKRPLRKIEKRKHVVMRRPKCGQDSIWILRKTSLCRFVLFSLENENRRKLLGGSYETAAEFHARRLAATMTLQRFLRGFRARREAHRRRQMKEEEAQRAAVEQKEDAEKLETQRQVERERRLHPKTRADFHLLHDELEQWGCQVKASLSSDLEVERRKEIKLRRTKTTNQFEAED